MYVHFGKMLSRGDNMSLKQSVLQILEENRSECISGQQLANKLLVSRAAIWKAINSLKNDGYSIDATTNKGYKLVEANDLLSKEGIMPYLNKEYADIPILVNQSVVSTNAEAKKLAVDNALHGTVVIADEQTGGRGRLGRKFYSPAKTGIYMSIILRPHMDITNATLITTAAAVAVCRAIKSICHMNPKIKWVNDIFIDHKKVCGILTEAVTDFESGMVESIIVGIGINYKTIQFPDDIREIATSLYSSESTTINRNSLIAAIINELFSLYSTLDNREFINEYKSYSMILGENIKYYHNNSEFFGKAIDIDNNGGLIVQTDQSDIITLTSGEITIRRLNNEKTNY